MICWVVNGKRLATERDGNLPVSTNTAAGRSTRWTFYSTVILGLILPVGSVMPSFRSPDCATGLFSMLSKITDLGRILGATVIFYYHIGLATGYRLFDWGEYAVATFIATSGIAYACFSSSKPRDLPSYNRYLLGRLKVIFPTFIAINTLIFLASFLHPSDLGRPFTPLEFLLSSVGMSQYFGFRYMSHVMWFIPFILQAYLIFPGIMVLLHRFPAVWIMLTAFGVSLSAIALAFVCLPPMGASGVCRNWCVVFRLPEVCLGLIIGENLLRRRDYAGGSMAVALFILLSFALAAVAAPRFGQATYILSLPWRGAVVTLLITALSSVLAPVITRAWTLRFMRLLGTASFPFFLIHGIAILFIHHRVGVAVAPWVLYFLFCWCEAVAITLAFDFAGRAIRRGPPHSRTVPIG